MSDRTLFNVCPDGEFFDRASEMERILCHAREGGIKPGIFLIGRRWMGKTEVLRRVHRELFWTQALVAPVYCQFKGYASPELFAEDFLREVLKQYLAFRRRDPRLVRSEVSIERLERMCLEAGIGSAEEIISTHREARGACDVMALLRNAFSSAEAVANGSGIPVYLMLDDIDLAPWALDKGSRSAASALRDVLNSGSFSFVASSSTRKTLEAGYGSAESLNLRGLDEETGASMLSDLCRIYGIEADTEVLKFAALRLEGNPMYMKNLAWAARRGFGRLSTLKDLIALYANELFDGNIGLALRSLVQGGGLRGLRLLYELASGKDVSTDEMAGILRCAASELKDDLDRLAGAGLVEANLGVLRWAGDAVARDFVSCVYEFRIKGRSAEEVKTAFIREGLKEGFSFKGLKARGALKDESAGLLKSFNGQKVLKVLLKNPSFAARYKDGAYKVSEARKDEDAVALPQIIGCFDSTRWEVSETGPPIIIAQGFQNGRYDSGNEVVWIAAVKDSLSPANLGDVESFLRRSAILKENFRNPRLVRWFIASEGFTVEAQKRMEAEGLYSSDSVQMRILRDSLSEKDSAERHKTAYRIVPGKEFEVVLPASTKAELVAAKAVEEIGTEMGFDENSIGQIKAALVEACINAFEHSKVKSGKVFLRFLAGDDRLTIHVSNSGVDLDSTEKTGAAASETELPRKRGWGFELMKGLMDEVRLEKLKGGARIVLVKYLIRKGESGGKA